MTDFCGFFLGSCFCLFLHSCCGSFPSLVDFSLLCMGSCFCLFLHSCCGSFPSLVDFSLLCMGSCCDLCRHRRLHVPPFHHCSSQLSHGCHKVESHPAPCMRQLHPSCPPSQ